MRVLSIIGIVVSLTEPVAGYPKAHQSINNILKLPFTAQRQAINHWLKGAVSCGRADEVEIISEFATAMNLPLDTRDLILTDFSENSEKINRQLVKHLTSQDIYYLENRKLYRLSQLEEFNVDLKDGDGLTALWRAVVTEKGPFPDFVYDLLDAGADPNATNNDGTFLYTAFRKIYAKHSSHNSLDYYDAVNAHLRMFGSMHAREIVYYFRRASKLRGYPENRVKQKYQTKEYADHLLRVIEE